MHRHSVLATFLFVLAVAAFSRVDAADALGAANTYNVIVPAGIPGGDCNDSSPDAYPGHVEVVGDRIDNDCDGLADEAPDDTPSGDTNDTDGDGISMNAGDCNDTAGSAHPGAVEIVGNFIDDDCDGLADEDVNDNPSNDVLDHDGDGVTIGVGLIFRDGFEPVQN